MAGELRMDLIRQAKMVTRTEAGLSDYDPTRDLPPLPSLPETVAAFDPSPPYLRCKNCKGRLLRGVQSVLCIYCGRPNDVPPDPISFKDTFAYCWLLESLHLDGSEMVGLTTEKSQLNMGQSTPKNIPLSDFLNLKVTWPTEVEKKENVSNKKTEERRFLNLTGFNLDNFFSGLQTFNASDTPEEHSLTSNRVEATEMKVAATHNDLSFFENVQQSKSVVHSSESKTAEAKEVATHGWEATFQSAESGDQFDSSKTFDAFVTSAVSSGNQHESSKSSDPFSGSTVDLSQLDSVFGPGEDLINGKTQDGTTASPSTGYWNDDLWNNLSSKVSQQAGQSDSTVGVQDAVLQDAQGNVSTSFDWFDVDQWQFNNVNTASNNTTHGDDDSFNEWNDFTSSTSINVSSSENSAIQSQNQPVAALGKTSELNLFSTDNKFEEMDFGSFSQADPFPSSSSKENVSAAMNDIGLEVSSSGRAVDAESDAGRGLGQSARDGEGDVKTAGTQQREDVEMILSQMHDLSFILENNLSLPSKSDDFHS